MGKTGVAIALAALLMAGCAAPSPRAGTTTSATVPLAASTALALEGAFAFNHTGGEVAFGLAGGTANLTVFAANDARIGAFRLTTTAPRHAFPAAPGELVIVAQPQSEPASGFWVTSGGQSIAWVRRLPVVSGFAVLGQDATLAASLAPEVFGPHVRPVNLTIEAPPVFGMGVVASGDYQNLEVDLHGDAGALVSASDYGGGFYPPIPTLTGHSTWELDGTTYTQNASGHHIAGTLRYDALDGAVLFWWTSYSRAGPKTPVQQTATTSSAALFSYGALGDGPAQATFVEGSTQVVLSNADDEGAVGVVQVWDPNDVRLGPFEVAAGGNVTVPLDAPGAYVFLRLNGTIELAVDRTPTDFELHPLEISTTEYPMRRAGDNGVFGFQEETMNPIGIPFALEASNDRPSTVVGFCEDEVALQVVEAGATLGSNGPGGWWQAALYLGDGPLVLRATGFGDDGCGQESVLLRSFLRP